MDLVIKRSSISPANRLWTHSATAGIPPRQSLAFSLWGSQPAGGSPKRNFRSTSMVKVVGQSSRSHDDNFRYGCSRLIEISNSQTKIRRQLICHQSLKRSVWLRARAFWFCRTFSGWRILTRWLKHRTRRAAFILPRLFSDIKRLRNYGDRLSLAAVNDVTWLRPQYITLSRRAKIAHVFHSTSVRQASPRHTSGSR